MKCLLIKTKDRRKFFTHEKNFFQLIEFSKTFKAEISTVILEEGPVLELEELAPAICDPTYKKSQAQYKVVESKMTNESRSRNEILKVASKVKNYIKKEFLARNVVSLDKLKNKFKKYKLTDASLCNHVRRAKEELAAEGIEITKIKAGNYKAN